MNPAIMEILSMCSTTRTTIEESLDNSREKSLALTKLDECVLWLSVIAVGTNQEEQNA